LHQFPDIIIFHAYHLHAGTFPPTVCEEIILTF
jgi:hypothetical protein